MDRFGLEEQQAGWCLLGKKSIGECLEISKRLIAFVGMTPDGHTMVDSYPKGGKGGLGFQIYQPLYESWLIISTWPAHGFIRVNLSSCKPFDSERVARFLIKEVGEIQCSWKSNL